MHRRRSKKSRKATSLKNKKFTVSPLLILQLFIIIICLGLSYFLWLDYRIHSEFKGKRWSLPTRVYAKPLEIYLGQRLTLAQIEHSLKATNYQFTGVVTRPGQYQKRDQTIEIYGRSFDYWGGQEDAARYRVSVISGEVNRIDDSITGNQLTHVRLEPQLIGKVYPDHNEDRILVRYDEVPQFLYDALLSVEDRGFYSHFGIDLYGILRAFLVNIRSGDIVQGGSTVTQQLVKNYFLTRERTLTRKINEMFMAVLLERRYSKKAILEAYINEIYLGQHGARSIHGFGTAAEYYYRKPLPELNRAQLALLIGLVRGASYYNPRAHPERAKARRDLVLKLMHQQKHLDNNDLLALQSQPLQIIEKPGWSQSKYPAFLDLAKRQLLEDYNIADLKNEGLRIFTTLDPIIQDTAEQKVLRRIESLEKDHSLPPDSLETASVIVRPENGEIVALIGGRDRDQAGFNRVVDARRPIGSLIKPFVYLTALSEPDAYNILSELMDSKISLPQKDDTTWQPDNYDHLQHGPITLIEAFVNSYNLATIHLGMSVGLEKIVKTLQNAGIKSGINPFPSLLLGSIDISPLQVAQSYQTLANGGYRVPIKTIRAVLDNQGKPLQRHQLEIEQVFDSGAVYLTNYLLTWVVKIGTARQLGQSFVNNETLAGKTGTTNDSRDSWFAGFSDDLLMVIWLGRDDNLPTPFSGATGAMRIWSDIMASLKIRSLNQVAPDEINWQEISGIKFKDSCLALNSIPYLTGSNPGNQLTC